jgi:hypothetical protein
MMLLSCLSMVVVVVLEGRSGDVGIVMHLMLSLRRLGAVMCCGCKVGVGGSWNGTSLFYLLASPSAPGERPPARTPEPVTPVQDPVRKRSARAEFWGMSRAKIKFLRRQVKI